MHTYRCLCIYCISVSSASGTFRSQRGFHMQTNRFKLIFVTWILHQNCLRKVLAWFHHLNVVLLKKQSENVMCNYRLYPGWATLGNYWALCLPRLKFEPKVQAVSLYWQSCTQTVLNLSQSQNIWQIIYYFILCYFIFFYVVLYFILFSFFYFFYYFILFIYFSLQLPYFQFPSNKFVSQKSFFKSLSINNNKAAKIWHQMWSEKKKTSQNILLCIIFNQAIIFSNHAKSVKLGLTVCIEDATDEISLCETKETGVLFQISSKCHVYQCYFHYKMRSQYIIWDVIEMTTQWKMSWLSLGKQRDICPH